MRCQNGFDDPRVTFYGGFFEIIFGPNKSKKIRWSQKILLKIICGPETDSEIIFYYIYFFIISHNTYMSNIFGENGKEIGIPILMEFDAIRP